MTPITWTNTLKVDGSGYLEGDVHFRVGATNTIEVDTDPDDPATGFQGNVSGIENLNLGGTGDTVVNNLNFTGSTVNLESGNLVVAGHLDLGSDGEMFIDDAGHLRIQVGAQDAAAAGIENIGHITAGKVTWRPGADRSLEVLYAPDLSETEQSGALSALASETVTLIDADTEGSVAVTDRTGRSIGTVTGGTASSPIGSTDGVQLATARQPVDPTSYVSVEPAGLLMRGGGGDTGGLLLAGRLAAFAFIVVAPTDLWGDDAMDDEEAKTGFGPASERREAGIEPWLKWADGGVTGTVAGWRTGLDAQSPDGFHAGVALMPEAALTAHDSGLQGNRFELRAGWRGERLFGHVDLAESRYTGAAAFDNLAGLGRLGGELSMRHTHIGATAGGHFEAGSLRLTPSMTLFGGESRQAGFTAGSAVTMADVPAFSQTYRGWRAQLTLAPTSWQEAGALRWRPELRLATARTATSGPEGLRVRQRDRAGAMRFSTPAAAGGLPENARAAALGVNAASGERWRLRAGLVAIAADDEVEHAAVAHFGWRF